MSAIAQIASLPVVASLRTVDSNSCGLCGSSSCSHWKSATALLANKRNNKSKSARAVRAVTRASGDNQFASVSSSTAPAPQAPAVSGPVIGLGLASAVIGGVVYSAVDKLFGGDKKASTAIAEKVQEVTPEFAAKAQPKPEKIMKQAAPAALVSIATHFPGAIQDELFVREISAELKRFGFSQQNSIAIVNTCRDEVCRPLANYIDEQLGMSFNLSGLGGLINSGKTGFKAAMSHSPEFVRRSDGKPYERYIFFAFPHISIGESGEVGSILRRGRGKPSSACGALIAIKNDATKGAAADNVDPDDAEYGLLKKKILSTAVCKNCGPAGPSLTDVTKAALEVITEDLERLISLTVDPATADYAVITGVQIHSGNQIPGEPFSLERTVDYVAPGAMYAVVEGKRYAMSLHHAAPAPKLPAEASNGAVSAPAPTKVPVGAKA